MINEEVPLEQQAAEREEALERRVERVGIVVRTLLKDKGTIDVDSLNQEQQSAVNDLINLSIRASAKNYPESGMEVADAGLATKAGSVVATILKQLKIMSSGPTTEYKQ